MNDQSPPNEAPTTAPTDRAAGSTRRTPAWKSALVGLAIGVGVVLATSPIGIYIAIGRDDEIRPGAIAVAVLWLVVLVLATVGGAVTPKLVRGIEARVDSDEPPVDPRSTRDE